MTSITVVDSVDLDPEEYAATVNESFIGSARTVDDLMWKWSDNGYGVPVFVVARDDEGSLLGAACFGAFAVESAGTVLTARLSYDTFVRPSSRGAGVFSALLREIGSAFERCDAAFNFPNANAAPGFAAAGWAAMQHAEQHSTMTLPKLTSRRSSVASEVAAETIEGREVWPRRGERVGWKPSVAHVAWRMARPDGATHLVRVDDVLVLATVHSRSGLREMRVLETWSDESAGTTLTALRTVAAFLGCRLATLPMSSEPTNVKRSVVGRGWLPRRSRAHLYLWQGSDLEAFRYPWRLPGIMFHTW